MITPVEIRRQQFPRTFRGYDPEAVDAFLQTLSEEWERQVGELQRLEQQHRQLTTQHQSLKEVEDVLHKTLLQAETSSKAALENARQEAALRMREAENKARDIVRQGIDERNRLQGEIAQLEQQRDTLATHLQVFYQAQLERLKQFAQKRLPTPPPPSLPTESGPAPNLFQATRNGHNALADDLAEAMDN